MQNDQLSLEEAARALAQSAEMAGRALREQAAKAQQDSQRAFAQIGDLREEVFTELKATREEVHQSLAANREDLQRIREATDNSANELTRARSTASNAWRAVAGLAIVVTVVIAYAASTSTRSSSQAQHLGSQIQQWRSATAQKEGEIGQLREDLITARMAQARTEGQLQAYTSTLISRQVNLPAPAAATPDNAQAQAPTDDAEMEDMDEVTPPDEPDTTTAAPPATRPVTTADAQANAAPIDGQP